MTAIKKFLECGVRGPHRRMSVSGRTMDNEQVTSKAGAGAAEEGVAGEGAPRKPLLFVGASLVGAFLFLTPVRDDGVWKIPLAVLSDGATALSRAFLDEFIVGVVLASAILSALYKARKAITRAAAQGAAADLLDPTWPWFAIRVLGAAAITMIYWELGPAWIHSEAVGGVVLGELAPVILIIFLFSGFLLPLLTEFGLMEFVGAFLQSSFQRLFRVPGRAAIDAVASWLGSGTVGVLITLKQYENGFYTAREASIVATNFSIVSTAFCYAVASLLKIADVFVPFYLAVVACALLCAMAMPRIPPLSLKKDVYVDGREKPRGEPAAAAAWSVGWTQACRKAGAAPGPAALLRKSTMNVLDIWLGLLPSVVFIGTAALGVATQTPTFDIIAAPVIMAMNAVGMEGAEAAGPAMLIGFADMFLPAIITADVESAFTRFFVGVVSVSQLIYMSELGVLILRSSIPLSFLELVAIFLLRTIIVAPIAYGASVLVVGAP